MNKVKILYVITKSDIGGAQKYVSDLAANLDQNRFEVKIVTGKDGKALSSNITCRWLTNSFQPHFLFTKDLLAVFELFRIFKRERPRIIHLNSSKAGVIGSLAASLYKVTCHMSHVTCPKVVFTAHGWVFNPDNDLGWLRRKFYVWLHKVAAKFQDRIINVSEYDRRLALSYMIALQEKLVTIHNGINHQNLKFLDKQTARKKLSDLVTSAEGESASGGKPLTLNPEGIWIGSISRLVKEKNYETYIEAASLLKDKSVKFFIIGSGPEHKKLEMRIEKLGLGGKFFIIENLAPAAPYLKAFDMFVLSSIKEGLPYTLLEAMAAELPIITTRVGGMTEIIDKPNNEKNGLAILPREPEELSRAINYLLENPQIARQLAAQAYKKVTSDLGIEKMLEKTEDIYL